MSTQYSVSENANLSATQVVVTGTGGNGYIELPLQASAPSTSGNLQLFRLTAYTYTFSWKLPDGYTRTFKTDIPSSNVTYTFPTTSATLSIPSASETYTNKTITDSSNSVTVSSLKTTGSNVAISATAPSAANYALMSTSTTAAGWSSLPTWMRAPFISFAQYNSTTSGTWTGYSQGGSIIIPAGITASRVTFGVKSDSGTTGEIRLITTDAVVIASTTFNSGGPFTVGDVTPITALPIANSVFCTTQIRRTSGSGTVYSSGVLLLVS